MASYAKYRHVELDRVGVGKKRVLKPPGGGSSIFFEEEDKAAKAKHQPQQQQQPKEEAEEAKEQLLPPPQQEKPAAPDNKAESNGMNSVKGIKEDAAATKDTEPFPSINGQHSPAPSDTPPAVNGSSPVVNGSTAVNGSVSSGSHGSSSVSPLPTGTPKHFNTQNRIFGEERNASTPRRRLRDHERSNIFSAEDNAHNGTHRPADSINSTTTNSSSSSSLTSCPSNNTPEQPQSQQRQRVPPGGFSTKLW